MTTQETHCSGCRQFENKHILTLGLLDYSDYAESQEANRGD